MLTTNLRTTQTLDPCTVVAPAVAVECVRPKPAPSPVTAAAYPLTASTNSALLAASDGGATRAFATSFATTGTVSIDASWLTNGRKPMPKVDLHPDRWPLQSTS